MKHSLKKHWKRNVCLQIDQLFFLAIDFLREQRGTVAFKTVCELKQGIIIELVFVQ